ncbi:hypothetical protein PF002_g11679 [Phytophthora fragariae]|uniref:Uncharacterized protein n=1 Tax=Phytophthora fragariae TaxID=53985 RepID=A0A6A4DSA0_9STRA|nr:hypothetical protein PF003_g4583 [Phytophthora fragariae]KAE9113856.1 hypothetical protein PF007_g10596 [Phytophthora fragariae]KAE9145476.1 hypothetical protein PF006_g9668 [Phytophthora fragariae]KAE9233494.1 hypothetical protein PF004_g9650 [Phytophthora fragariae]KAE9234875.1 hypothetical protein PF002_g11679 [Phytophthora fragariae]
MAPKLVDVGALAFLGPPHAADFVKFPYVRVTRVNGDLAYMNVIAPNGVAENSTDPIAMTVLHRLAFNDECERLPGSFAGKPVAYIRPAGVDADTWA